MKTIKSDSLVIEKINVSDLSFSYNNDTMVLENINFSVHKGEIVSIIGPNGGGKTTLLRLLLGLLKPDSGSILINGKSPGTNQKEIGYVPQHALFDKKFPITVFEAVLSGLVKPIGFYSKKEKQAAMNSLKTVEMESFADRPFSQLSGGQTQRVLIARALSFKPDILLLDEPTANIDPIAGKNIHKLLKELSKDITILLVTHDTNFVSNITDRVFCINKQLNEHPIDESFSSIVASSYGVGTKFVKHTTSLDKCPLHPHFHKSIYEDLDKTKNCCNETQKKEGKK